MRERQKVLRGVTIGSTTLCLFEGLPVARAGWLLKAWLAYRMDGTEPETIPPASLGEWLSVKHEVDAMAALSRNRSNAGRSGMARRYGKDFVITNPNTVITSANREEKEKESKRENGAGDARAATPAQPAPSPAPVAVKAPAGLAVEMEGAPLTAEEAWAYATGGQVAAPATAKQVIKWANCQSKNGWRNKAGFLMRRSEAEASLRGWLMDDLSRRSGAPAAADATVRGVRVANRGGGLTADF